MASTVIAGKPSNTVGDKDSTLVLRGSSVKIQWGNKFIDLIKNGKINVEHNKILKTIDSAENIKDDGIYLVEDQVWLMLDGTKVQLSGDISTVYVSFVNPQNINSEGKTTALKNIGFYYDTLEQAESAGITSGIIYVLGDNKLYTVVNGIFSEYSISNNEEKIEEILKDTLYIEGNSLYVDGDEYIRCENNQIIAIKQLITENGVYSPGATAENGYRLYIKDGKSYLEVDEVIERNSSRLDIYEYIKVYSEHNNIVTACNVMSDNKVQCVLQEPNKYNVGDYIYVVGTVEAYDSYKNGVITIILNKPSTFDIKGTIEYDNNSVDITIPAGTTQVQFAGQEDYLLQLPIGKELFEYKIKESDKQTITIDNADSTFINNCKYLYSSRKPLIKIKDNNLTVLDRSVMIEGNPDETEHTRIGIIKEDEIDQLKEEYKEPEDRPQVGIFSDNLITLNQFLYNPTFKTIRKDKETKHPKYPIYDKEIELPKDKLLVNKMFNYSVPDIEWIKRMMDLWIPVGTIIMFNGEEIPPGWAICNGDQGTPNLIGRFIKADYETGKVDPEGVTEDNKVVIKKENLPYFNTKEAGGFKVSTTSVVSPITGDNISSVPTKTVVGSISLGTEFSHSHIVDFGNEPMSIEPRHYKLIFIMKIQNFIDIE